MSRVLIFDSGIGGLSIYQRVKEACPDLAFTYLCDHLAFPYGEKTADQLRQRVDGFLMPQIERYRPDLVIVACNTASTQLLDYVRSLHEGPVVGVVPAIKPAAGLTSSGRIALIATEATIRAAYTENLIREFAAGCDVLKIPCNQMVHLAERAFCGAKIGSSEIKEALGTASCLNDQVDTVVLGCTHFPFLQACLAQTYPQVLHWVDSGHAIARRVGSLLDPVRRTEDPSDYFVCSKDLDPSLAKVISRMGFIPAGDEPDPSSQPP